MYIINLNITIQNIKTLKTQQSTQNHISIDDDKKYGRKGLGRRYVTIPLPSRFRH